jgi:hypothetical protein
MTKKNKPAYPLPQKSRLIDHGGGYTALNFGLLNNPAMMTAGTQNNGIAS